jgi:hypothetical protein
MGRKFTTRLENWEDSQAAMPARLRVIRWSENGTSHIRRSPPNHANERRPPAFLAAIYLWSRLKLYVPFQL